MLNFTVANKKNIIYYFFPAVLCFLFNYSLVHLYSLLKAGMLSPEISVYPLLWLVSIYVCFKLIVYIEYEG